MTRIGLLYVERVARAVAKRNSGSCVCVCVRSHKEPRITHVYNAERERVYIYIYVYIHNGPRRHGKSIARVYPFAVAVSTTERKRDADGTFYFFYFSSTILGSTRMGGEGEDFYAREYHRVHTTHARRHRRRSFGFTLKYRRRRCTMPTTTPSAIVARLFVPSFAVTT